MKQIFSFRYKIKSLIDLLNEKLEKIAKKYKMILNDFENLKKEDKNQLEKLAKDYGFINCRQPYEEEFSKYDLFSMLNQDFNRIKINNKNKKKYNDLLSKYFKDIYFHELLNIFREWMRVRNQEMEFLYYAYLKSKSIFYEIFNKLKVPIKDIWNCSYIHILNAIQKNDPKLITEFKTENLTIFHYNGKLNTSNKIKVQKSTLDKKGVFRGKTVY